MVACLYFCEMQAEVEPESDWFSWGGADKVEWDRAGRTKDELRQDYWFLKRAWSVDTHARRTGFVAHTLFACCQPCHSFVVDTNALTSAVGGAGTLHNAGRRSFGGRV